MDISGPNSDFLTQISRRSSNKATHVGPHVNLSAGTAGPPMIHNDWEISNT